jgi:hypothetical protein
MGQSMRTPGSDQRGPAVADIVRQKADHLRRERSLGADKPCVRCVHYEPGNWSWLLPFTVRCAHPVFTEHQVNRVTGQLVMRSRTTPADARSPGSLCGPDAFLFEEKSKWRRFKRWLGQRLGGAEEESPQVPERR